MSKLNDLVTEIKEGFVMGLTKRYLKNNGIEKKVVFFREANFEQAALYSYTDDVICFNISSMKKYQKELGLNLLFYVQLLCQDLANVIENHEVSAF